MGTTHQPLIIWVHSKWKDRPEVKALTEKGHDVREALFHDPDAPHVEADDPDLILHPAAHWWDDAMFDKPAYLEAAMKAARKRKYGGKPKWKKK